MNTMKSHSQKLRIWTQNNLSLNLIPTTSWFRGNELDLIKPSGLPPLDSRQGVSEIRVYEALHRNVLIIFIIFEYPVPFSLLIICLGLFHGETNYTFFLYLYQNLVSRIFYFYEMN